MGKFIALFLALALLVSPAAVRAEDTGDFKAQAATLTVIGVATRLLIGTAAGAAADSVVLFGQGGLGAAIIVGNVLEYQGEKRLAAAGLYRYSIKNPQGERIGEDRKWSNDADRPNWKTLKGYTYQSGPGLAPAPEPVRKKWQRPANGHGFMVRAV